MQSIEYKITSFSPKIGEIENITSLNPQTYWESPEDSATIDIEFSECIVKDLQLFIENSCSFIFVGWDSDGRSYSLVESSINGKKPQNFPIKSENLLSKCQLQITSNDKNLRIYSMIIKSTREEVKTPTKSKFSQKNFQSKAFYHPNNGSSAKKLEIKSNSNLKQTTLFNSRVFLDPAPNEKNLNKMMDNVEFIDDQRKIYENIKNNRQKTLRSYTSKQRVPSHSYQNLFAENASNNYVVCCKENPDVEAFIEEICKILGVCFLFELEEGVTHLIYEGFDQDIINFAKQLGVIIVDKRWLLDSINQRESLNPDLYKRNV